jgi:hypothetical protein
MKPGFLFFLLLVLGCSDYNCEFFVEEFRKEEHNLVISKKYLKNRYNIFIGQEDSIRNDTIFFVGRDDLFQTAKTGDSLIKVKGNAYMVLISNATRDTFFAYCNGKKIK